MQTVTTFDALLKQHYTSDRIYKMLYEDQPLLALSPKSTDFYGRNLPVPIIFGTGQGRSASFARAQTRAAATRALSEDFLLTRVNDYALAHLSNEVIRAARANADAFVSAATTELDGALMNLKRSMGQAMYRSGLGEIGRVGSFSTTTITLANIQDVVNFEVGQELEVASAVDAASRAFGSSGNGLIITAVNRDSGVLTFGFNVDDATNGIPAIAANDFIFVRGDHNAAVRVKLAGLGAWVPTSAPTSTAFFGVDRSVDVTRLGGIRQTAGAKPIEEALVDAAMRVGREGFTLDHFFMSHDKMGQLIKALGAKVQYVEMQATAQVGFRGVLINAGNAQVKCVADVNCPDNLIYGVKLDTWKLYTMGDVGFIGPEGSDGMSLPTADGVEYRMGYYGNLACRAPGANCVISF